MKDIEFFSFKSSVLCSFQWIMLLSTAIHFNRCLEVHTTINDTFGRVPMKTKVENAIYFQIADILEFVIKV
jgi:hypothetical protein